VTYNENHKDTETQRHRGRDQELLFARLCAFVSLCLCGSHVCSPVWFLLRGGCWEPPAQQKVPKRIRCRHRDEAGRPAP
jgi:hypothetical protein